MSLKLEIKEISGFLTKIEKEKKKHSENNDDLFGGLKVVPRVFPPAKLLFDKPKFRQYFAQPYNLIHVAKFLDIESILNLGLMNKEFNVFISSIYMLRMLTTKKKKKLKTNSTIQSLSPKSVSSSSSIDSAKKKNNYVSGLLRNMGNFFFGGSRDTKFKISPPEMNLRMTLHEEILNKIKKRFEIDSEIKHIRDEADLILNRKNIPLVKKKISEKETGNEFDSIKLELIKKENLDLEQEVDSLKKEIEKLKRKVEYYEINDIEKAKSLSSMRSYLENNIKLDTIKLTYEAELKSGKFDHLYDFDISTIAHYDDFLNQDN